MNKLLSVIVLIIIVTNFSFAQTSDVKKEKKQFLYVLRLEKSMYDSTAWTPDKQKIVQDHFVRLQKMLSGGSLILAGRTQVSFDKTIGLVVFEADSFEEAKLIAENDPAVKGKVMTVEVFPYEVALIREKEKK
ncbi:hypothetical protein C0389_06490 [bacterium]|nr:hypothetical protein [bacterium]